jgi:hypothetical protein
MTMTELRPLTDHYCPTDAGHDESDGSHEERLLVRDRWLAEPGQNARIEQKHQRQAAERLSRVRMHV